MTISWRRDRTRHETRSPGPWTLRLALSLALLAAGARAASADRYEAQWSVRPLAGVALVGEEGSASSGTEAGSKTVVSSPADLVPAAGMSLGVSYGISNRVDLDAEIVTMATATSTFPDTSLEVDGGAAARHPFTRRSGAALLLLGATWRFGVAWVPVVSIGGGGGVRYRSAGRFPEIDFMPSERGETVTADLTGRARVGIERRVNRRLTVGAYMSVLASWSPSAPLLPVASLSFGVSYAHYPLW